MSDGWIKLSRRLLENELWKEPRRFSRAEAWIDLLFSAEFEGERMGIVAKSLSELGSRWGWPRTNVQRFMKSLVAKNQLVSLGSKCGTRAEQQVEQYGIVNYEVYQGLKKPRRVSLEQQVVAKRNTSTDRSLCTSTIKEERSTPLPPSLEIEDEPLTVIFPTELDNFECRKAWADFVSHRRRIKKPFRTIEAQNVALKRAAKHGATAFVASVEESIANEWQGFFPEKHAADAQTVRAPHKSRLQLRDEEWEETKRRAKASRDALNAKLGRA